ncbi:glycosyl transferase family 2 [Floricoccus penangensis]|uniref:Glycosyl transferase family 2 n=1 Tax=Floricoccus penangensis TaxID=1859475 RepID=A0A9Q5JI24_9LACT|nr:glycosyltransferase family 2 protein [Floricoccus penangensis]OFI47931.1 glycosyl transferase family 2 [Floricoccus penangensis]
MKKVLLIIPAYNEEKSIQNTVKMVEDFKDENKLPFTLDYIVINDGSKDGTEKILDDNKLNHIDLVQNLGIGGAVQTGYLFASRNRYDVAVQFDGDGQHDIASIEDVVSPILSGQYDFTIGSRFIEENAENFKSSKARRIGINLISYAIKFVTGNKIYDTTSGYRAANKSVIRYFSKNYPMAYPEPESIVRLMKHGYKVKEVPAHMFERAEGESSISAFKSVTYMMDVLTSIFIAGFMKEAE